METILLPSGATALLRDPKEVTERARRPITRLSSKLAAGQVGDLLEKQAALSETAFEEEARKILATPDWGILDEINDLLIVALVSSWSFDFPITTDSVLDLPGPDYEALKAATAKHMTAVLPDFSPSPDPESPTAP